MAGITSRVDGSSSSHKPYQNRLRLIQMGLKKKEKKTRVPRTVFPCSMLIIFFWQRQGPMFLVFLAKKWLGCENAEEHFARVLVGITRRRNFREIPQGLYYYWYYTVPGWLPLALTCPTCSQKGSASCQSSCQSSPQWLADVPGSRTSSCREEWPM